MCTGKWSVILLRDVAAPLPVAASTPQQSVGDMARRMEGRRSLRATPHLGSVANRHTLIAVSDQSIAAGLGHGCQLLKPRSVPRIETTH